MQFTYLIIASLFVRNLRKVIDPNYRPLPFWLVAGVFLLPFLFSWFVFFGNYHRQARILSAVWLIASLALAIAF